MAIFYKGLSGKTKYSKFEGKEKEEELNYKAHLPFIRANAFNFFNPELEQAKASDGYRMKFGKQKRRS